MQMLVISYNGSYDSSPVCCHIVVYHSIPTVSLLCHYRIGEEKWRTYISSTSEITASDSITNFNFNLTLIHCSN